MVSPQSTHRKYSKKSLGQNFLIDPNYKRKILECLRFNPSDCMLEIGPGRGVLTDVCVQNCEKVWLIEKDDALASALKEKYASKDTVIPAKAGIQKPLRILDSRFRGNDDSVEEHISILNQDVLDVSFEELFQKYPKKIKVVGNLPYNVASQIFIKLVENKIFFSEFYLMFQKEMALRFVAKPSTKDYGLLSLWAQIYTDCKILFHLPPTAFYPRPRVQSSFLYFRIQEKPLIEDKEAEDFFAFMRILFQQRRKTIRSVLKNHPEIRLDAADAWLPPHARAEEFSVPDLVKFYRGLNQDLISP